MGALYTTSQRDLKRLLGYSSTENVGIAGIGFGIGYLGLAWHQPALVALGFTGGILHLLNHAFFKCLLFYAAGAVYKSTHSVNLERLGGLARRMPWTAGFFLLGGLAISGLPPFNGFISEFLVYAGLVNEAAPAGIERGTFIAVAALLAFVGGVSALAMTRAFGLVFLGKAREPVVHCDGEVTAWLRLPMLVHAAGLLALGLLPGLGLAIVDRPVRLFLAGASGPGPVAALAAARLLEPVQRVALVLLLVLAALFLLRRWLLRGAPAPRSATWGCGYVGATPRMQYTGASFSAQFTDVFSTILQQLRRERLPSGPFPGEGDHLQTHSVDVVEQRMLKAIGDGDNLVVRLEHRIPVEPRFSLAAGLVVVVVVIGMLVTGAGGGR
jgi:hydrogenase-4 component B